mmetsp:Transcript_51908/g.166170  ORF Transcript_51908/g.166170 Transcript_51908/m.166170 type:complete len:228 (-) Transcript_51908:2929-3612(-)
MVDTALSSFSSTALCRNAGQRFRNSALGHLSFSNLGLSGLLWRNAFIESLKHCLIVPTRSSLFTLVSLFSFPAASICWRMSALWLSMPSFFAWKVKMSSEKVRARFSKSTTSSDTRWSTQTSLSERATSSFRWKSLTSCSVLRAWRPMSMPLVNASHSSPYFCSVNSIASSGGVQSTMHLLKRGSLLTSRSTASSKSLGEGENSPSRRTRTMTLEPLCWMERRVVSA